MDKKTFEDKLKPDQLDNVSGGSNVPCTTKVKRPDQNQMQNSEGQPSNPQAPSTTHAYPEGQKDSPMPGSGYAAGAYD